MRCVTGSVSAFALLVAMGCSASADQDKKAKPAKKAKKAGGGGGAGGRDTKSRASGKSCKSILKKTPKIQVTELSLEAPKQLEIHFSNPFEPGSTATTSSTTDKSLPSSTAAHGANGGGGFAAGGLEVLPASGPRSASNVSSLARDQFVNSDKPVSGNGSHTDRSSQASNMSTSCSSVTGSQIGRKTKSTKVPPKLIAGVDYDLLTKPQLIGISAWVDRFVQESRFPLLDPQDTAGAERRRAEPSLSAQLFALPPPKSARSPYRKPKDGGGDDAVRRDLHSVAPQHSTGGSTASKASGSSYARVAQDTPSSRPPMM